MQKETPPGQCIFCGAPCNRPGRKRSFMCFRADCATLYNTIYVNWRRDQLRAQGLTARGTRRKKGA